MESPPESGGKWYLQTEDGQQYGPIGREELDAWFADGRIDTSCQILSEGWESWRWADEVYPQLNEGAAEGEMASASAGAFTAGEAEAVASTQAPWSAGIGDLPENPYAAPREAATPIPSGAQPTTETGITPKIRQEFMETRPWVMLLSILSFVSAGLSALAALGLLVSGGIMSIINGLVGLVMAAIPGISAYLMYTFASKLAMFLKTDKTQDLESAMTAQKMFWKFTGILACVGVGLAVIMMVLAVVAIIIASVALGNIGR
jgi:hypothetical protein